MTFIIVFYSPNYRNQINIIGINLKHKNNLIQ